VGDVGDPAVTGSQTHDLTRPPPSFMVWPCNGGIAQRWFF